MMSCLVLFSSFLFSYCNGIATGNWSKKRGFVTSGIIRLTKKLLWKINIVGIAI